MLELPKQNAQEQLVWAWTTALVFPLAHTIRRETVSTVEGIYRKAKIGSEGK